MVVAVATMLRQLAAKDHVHYQLVLMVPAPLAVVPVMLGPQVTEELVLRPHEVNYNSGEAFGGNRCMLGPQVTERHVLRPHRGVLVAASIAEALRVRRVWRRWILGPPWLRLSVPLIGAGSPIS